MSTIRIAFALLTVTLFGANCQENAGNNVAPSLLECYNQTELLDRDRRPPSSINILIDLIRKIEDGPTSFDARQLAVNLIHRFRQDGILRADGTVSSTPGVLPYKPRGFQQAKHILLLTKLIPGNAANFPNETLSAVERCSMHFMMSNSIDDRLRGDEEGVCSRLSKYQTRITREASDNPKEEIEMIYPRSSQQVKGNFVLDDDVEIDPQASFNPNDSRPVPVPGSGTGRGVVTTHKSDCPVESGVIYTKWGAVAAGNMLAGIAAGLEQQIVPGADIKIGGRTVRLDIDNRYAATLAGDLAETSLHQGPVYDTVNVGCPGGWNSTQAPRWYFIEKDKESVWYLTDAEIRGGLDGLIMAMNVKEWVSKASNLKVSQILDMYYSPRGVFSKDIRACRRRELLTTVAPTSKINNETTAFSALLDKESQLEVSISNAEAFQKYSDIAVERMYTYVAQNLNDLNCGVEEDVAITTASNITIILDTQWPYRYIEPALSHLLSNIDMHRYGSDVTIINAKDGQTIMNTTNSIADFHILVNQSIYEKHPSGFDSANTLNNIERIMKNMMENEKLKSTANERSSVFLVMPYSAMMGETERNFAIEKKQYFKEYLPDIKILVMAKSKEAYSDLVVDSSKDLFTLTETTEGSNIFSDMAPLITRTKEIPRRIVNPNCGVDWSGDSKTDTVNQYVEPESVNYYRIQPNYFYDEEVEATVKVRGQGSNSLSVCESRQNPLPRAGDSSNSAANSEDVKCQSITSNEYVITLSNVCGGYDTIADCPPLYFSVESKQNPSEMAFQCTDAGCRFPNSVRFSITTEGLRCASGSLSLISSIGLIGLMLVVLGL